MTETTDTPTHRVHILQAQFAQVLEWTQLLQTQRAAIVEKVARIKASNKIAREEQINAALGRLMKKLLRDLTSTETTLNKIADNLNKARGLFLELTDGELLLERTTHVHGSNLAEGPAHRGNTSPSGSGPESDERSVHDSGETAHSASTDI